MFIGFCFSIGGEEEDIRNERDEEFQVEQIKRKLWWRRKER